MRWTDRFTALVVYAWGFLLMTGISGLLAIKSRHVPDYPAAGQVILYAGVPTVFLILLIVIIVLSRRARWFCDVYPFAVGLLTVLTFPVLIFWGGGV